MRPGQKKRVEAFIESAVAAGATIVHVEPGTVHARVRYRIDGLLQNAPNEKPDITSRIKTFCHLKSTEQVPQTEQCNVTIAGKTYLIRIASMPTSQGEKVVLHIKNVSEAIPTLEKLGYSDRNLAALTNAIVQPHGLVLAVGPHTSGITTTLYSALVAIDNDATSIATIEDTIEAYLPRVTQTPINPKLGLTYVAGLRAAMRQDPNVILVGELRDSETAELALHAAMSGRLVFSTLLAPDAAAAITQLQAMGLPAYALASTVRAIAAQRLVRQLCHACKQPHHLDKKEWATILKTIDHHGPISAAALGWHAKDTGEKTTVWRASTRGCKTCHRTGYKGQLAITEALPITSTVQKLITSHARTTALHKQAVQDGMITMQHDGLLKAIAGLTSIEEVLRTTR